mgnify:FL=1
MRPCRLLAGHYDRCILGYTVPDLPSRQYFKYRAIMADAQPSDPVHCPICHVRQARFWFIKNDFHIWRCQECGFIFVHPHPEDTAHIYAGEDYFRGTNRGFGYIDYEADKIPLRPFSETLLDRIERLLPSRGELLDVGTASGFFLKLAKE